MRASQLLSIPLSLALVTSAAQAEDHTGRNAGRRLREHLEYKAHSITSDLNIEVIPGCLDADRQGLLDKLNAGKEVPFNALTDALVALHLSKKPGPKAETVDEILGKIRTGVDRSDLSKMKVDYEALLEKHHGRPMIYNAKNVSIGDICGDNRMQCYSGTVLNQVIARKVLSRDDFMAKNPVILYESGHILPGYAVAEGDHWHLYGIETTAKGPAVIDYGLTKDLKKALNGARGDDWIQQEIFKDCLKDPSSLAAKILARAAEKYGFPANLIKGTKMPLVAGGTPSPKETPLNASALGFGEPPPDRGDVERVEFNHRPRSDFSENSNRTAAEGAAIALPAPAPGMDLNLLPGAMEVAPADETELATQQLIHALPRGMFYSKITPGMEQLLLDSTIDPNVRIPFSGSNFFESQAPARVPLLYYLVHNERADLALKLLKKYPKMDIQAGVETAASQHAGRDVLAALFYRRPDRTKEGFSYLETKETDDDMLLAAELARRGFKVNFTASDETLVRRVAEHPVWMKAFLAFKPDLDTRSPFPTFTATDMKNEFKMEFERTERSLKVLRRLESQEAVNHRQAKELLDAYLKNGGGK